MQIVLEKPPGKNWSLMFNELTGDDNYVPYRHCFWECPDSQRWEANDVLKDLAKKHGLGSAIFNQYTWVGTTGCEFWSDKVDSILAVAIDAGQHFGLEVSIGDIYS